MNAHEQFLISLAELRQRIKDACERCGRRMDEVELMAVTKTHPAVAVDWAVGAGLRRIGENRVQEAADKRPQAKRTDGVWELIGPLQSNKARLATGACPRPPVRGNRAQRPSHSHAGQCRGGSGQARL